MRRAVSNALGVVAAAGFLVLGGSQTAQAATGDLVINGQHYQNPSGCYPVSGSASIQNNTDARVTLHPDPACSGPENGWISPGGSGTLMPVYGVKVP
jgi:hypothetical protein